MALRAYVQGGGRCDVRNEVREEWRAERPEHPYWYRFVLPWEGLAKGLFIEVLLIDDDEDEPFVEIVNAPHR